MITPNDGMHTDIAVIGGGVIGLAVAARLAPEKSLVLFERNEAWGQEISSRNSEVLHSGIYYEPGSLKAKLCVRGQRLLYELAETADIPHRRCGKIIIASSKNEIDELLRLQMQAEQNGVGDLSMLTSEEVMEREPFVSASAGLLVPASGIINAHDLMDTLAKQAEEADAALVCGAEVTGLEKRADCWNILFRDSAGEDNIFARIVINCAGLGAQQVMRMAGIDPNESNLTLYYAKGEYFTVPSTYRKKINAMIYPVPAKNLVGLGVHTVPDLSGGFKLGPNAFYVNELDYTVDASHASEFYDRARCYLPELQLEDLVPDMSGIRPKLSAEGAPPRDFYIRHEANRDAEGFINLAGIESPGLTSCLAIGEHIANLICNLL